MFPRRLLLKEKAHILASVNKNKIYNVLFFLSQSQTPLVHLCANIVLGQDFFRSIKIQLDCEAQGT